METPSARYVGISMDEAIVICSKLMAEDCAYHRLAVFDECGQKALDHRRIDGVWCGQAFSTSTSSQGKR